MSSIKIVHKHGDNEKWAQKNPILNAGEIGVVTSGDNKGDIKIGDGVTPWNDLPFLTATGSAASKATQALNRANSAYSVAQTASSNLSTVSSNLSTALANAAAALAAANNAYDVAQAASAGAADALDAANSGYAAAQAASAGAADALDAANNAYDVAQAASAGVANALSVANSAAAAASTGAANAASAVASAYSDLSSLIDSKTATKTRTYHQMSAPTGNLTYGDMWFDTDNDNRMRYWDGNSWVSASLGNTAITNIDAGKITTGTIAAGRIAAGSITAEMLSAGSITADKLSAGSITAEKLTATLSLYGKTIIGGTISTIDPASGGARIALTADGLYSYNPSGNLTFSIIASTGNVTSIGGSIQGATISSRLDGGTRAAVVLNGTGLYAYNSSGTNTFSLAASNGSVIATGGSWYAGSISGATISSRSDGATNASVVLNANGLYAYDASGVNTFSLAASNGSVIATGGSWYAGFIGAGELYTRSDKVKNACIAIDTTGLYSYDSSGTAKFTLTATTGVVNIVSRTLNGLQFDGQNDKIAFLKGGVEKGAIKSYLDDTYGGVSITHTSGSFCYVGANTVSIGANTSMATLNLTTAATLTSTAAVYLASGDTTLSVRSTGIYIGDGIATAGSTVVGPDPVYSKAIYDNPTSSSGNVYIGSDSRLYKSTAGSSSRNIKNSITDLSVNLDARKLLDVPIRQFKYNKDFLTNKNDSRYNTFVPGFIADELAEVYPIAVEYEDGNPIGWNYMYLLPPMLKLIQDQQKTIESLVSRVDSLEKASK